MICLRNIVIHRGLPMMIPAMLAGVALAADYQVTDLGTLGGPSSIPFAINESGVVVGESHVTAGDSTLAFIWDGQMTSLGQLPAYTQSAAFGVNDAGLIAGVAYNLGDLDSHAVNWTLSQPTELGAFTARAINDSGEVAGSTIVDLGGMDYVSRAARWTGGAPVTLGTLGGETSEALAISNSGWIVGNSTTGVSTPPHAFVWISSSMFDLGTLGGDYSAAHGVNDAGEVVGVSRNALGVMHAFRFVVNASGTVLTRTDLGELGGDYSAAYAVNALGDIVGTSDDKAFLWSGGPIIDLNTLIAPSSGWVLNRATAINNAGEIVGQGVHDGETRAFLLTPALSGDLDGDGDVDSTDLSILLANFGKTSGATPEEGDIDGDGDVDSTDLSILLTNFGAAFP